jgi:hypothetical protein
MIILPGVAVLGFYIANDWWILHLFAFIFTFSMGFVLRSLFLKLRTFI